MQCDLPENKNQQNKNITHLQIPTFYTDKTNSKKPFLLNIHLKNTAE